MNFLFFYSSEISEQKGGVQRVTHNLSEYFTSLGHKVDYLAVYKSESNSEGNINQYFLPNFEHIQSKENINFYKNLVRNNDIHIIINQSGIAPNLTKFCIQIKKYFEIKVISVFHNSLLGNAHNFTSSHSAHLNRFPFLIDLFQTKLISKILLQIYILKYKRHYSYSYKEFDQLVFLSESYYSELRVFVPDYEEIKITSIANPTTLIVNSKENSKHNELLYVGRLNTSQKRVDLLLEIWSKILKEFPDWELSIVGDGLERVMLEEKSKIMGLERVQFYGLRNPVPYYERSKILCMTSAYEGFPLVLAEAQAFGVVPIAFESFASIKDIITDGETGILIEPFNVDQYTLRLSQLMIDCDYTLKLSTACMNSVDRFSIERIGASWLSLFKNLLRSCN